MGKYVQLGPEMSLCLPQQSSVLSNGLAGNGAPLAGKEEHGNREAVSVISSPAPFLVDAVTSSAPALAEEAVLKQKCLLTTEL